MRGRGPLITALGSSFASGPGLAPLEDPAAQRSSVNYAHVLAELLGARLIDLTVAGATTSTILDEPQVTALGDEFAPQIQGVPADADIVTVTAGGNDLEFIGSLKWAALQQADPRGAEKAVAEVMLDAGPARVVEPTPESVDAAAAGLARIVTEIHDRAPGARILLVDYLTLLPPDPSLASDLFPPEHLPGLMRIQEAVGEAFGRAADQSGAEPIRASTLSRDRALGSPDPWVTGLDLHPSRWVGSFHPTAAGMRAVGEQIAEHLAR